MTDKDLLDAVEVLLLEFDQLSGCGCDMCRARLAAGKGLLQAMERELTSPLGQQRLPLSKH
jgi:hypothetical protein